MSFFRARSYESSGHVHLGAYSEFQSIGSEMLLLPVNGIQVHCKQPFHSSSVPLLEILIIRTHTPENRWAKYLAEKKKTRKDPNKPWTLTSRPCPYHKTTTASLPNHVRIMWL